MITCVAVRLLGLVFIEAFLGVEAFVANLALVDFGVLPFVFDHGHSTREQQHANGTSMRWVATTSTSTTTP